MMVFKTKTLWTFVIKVYVILSFLQTTQTVLVDAVAMNGRVEEYEKNEVVKKERNVWFE